MASAFIDSLFEPENTCVCSHHEGSHCYGISDNACMWCLCSKFEKLSAGDKYMSYKKRLPTNI